METPIELSIVVPAYNADAFLDRLFTSFLTMAGDVTRCELIVVNDGSTDATPALINQWMARGQMPLRLVNTPGLGPGQAREAGALHAQAPWVALVDADEYFSPGWLRAALDFVDAPGNAVGCEGVVEICDRNTISLFTHQTQSLTPGRYLTANLILKRDRVRFYKGYGRRFYFREDSDLAFQLLADGETIAHSPNLLLYHPPLPAVWWQPIRLALRYQYDALLAYRFPRRYWVDVDVHLRIPHLRLLLLLLCSLLQITGLVLLVKHIAMGTPPWLPLGLLAVSPLLSLVPVLLYVPPQQIRLAQLPPAWLVHQVVPLLTLGSWVYGFWQHRGEPRYCPHP
ncbi:glycosyltransferase family 2 protein [Nodosilinea sp. LEGE 07088]|uniref:glycosyltransferase family 2 protein n=1 Tax=Nodosilinea sp. LEGE 07088 TaxID=2777968 RepID=UPI00188249C0|nr:glycosyltransferase family 2 protein [Nodosilinea sp. LEGE 07088]MBE9136020.1 glycosyltransferase family 2 protein [Nodosilinea sp. LEGE 07088]